ncbi:hypothetical protein RM545_00135 [Zunongwangia sp. F260]|uniref:ATP synthase F0 subunit 8 n=1 Tax=Autumnicola lenta TaxID=3075593 RepID=A0ABU3CFF6_9FLAO|nr:hypothetical protein [Zunongwangia sp. F260]MDT0645084.1 hypothetical protein [Zunongwangia sp. F260]
MDLSFNLKDLTISIAILTGLLTFLIYWFTFKSEKLQFHFKNKYGEDKGHVNFILFTRYLGGIVWVFCLF